MDGHSTPRHSTETLFITAIRASSLGIPCTVRLAEAVIRRRAPWKSIDAVEYATLEWQQGFNTQRLLEPLGNVSPIEYEEAYQRSQTTEDMTTAVTHIGLRETRFGSISGDGR